MATKKPTAPTTSKRKAKRSRELSSAERIAALGAQIPDEEMAKMPRDGAMNHDHYIYGTPKKYDPLTGEPYANGDDPIVPDSSTAD